MATTRDLWTPPEGMSPQVVSAWRRFYGKALDLYGITPAEYRLLYVAQKGRCWICRLAKGVHPDDPKGRGTRRLGVDHDHVTGDVRGLLCTGGDKTCNRTIGWHTAPALDRAAAYLRARNGQPARVLDEVRRQVGEAEGVGVQLTQDEVDRLAQHYLWRD